VSQSGVTGSGSSSNPFEVVTVANAGGTGLRLRETDRYVVGDEIYTTEVRINNTSGSSRTATLYRAGDCFLAESDDGFGFTETSGTRKSVGCSLNANNNPADRIEEWIPLTGGNDFVEDAYSTVWSDIGSKTAFPNTCECAIFQDNGAGISWTATIPAGGSASYLQATAFSPTGKEPLSTTKTAERPAAGRGSQNGYTIRISNPNSEAVTLNSIVDTLPSGFSYVSGSTTGVTTSNPSIAGRTLTWSGPFSVPTNGSVSLRFNVTVSNAPGDYFNNATGDAANGFTVVPTGDTAKITVNGGPPPPPPPPPGGPVWEAAHTDPASGCSAKVQSPYLDTNQQVTAYTKVSCPRETRLTIRSRLRSDHRFDRPLFRNVTVAQKGCVPGCVVNQPAGTRFYKLTCPKSNSRTSNQKYFTDIIIYAGTSPSPTSPFPQRSRPSTLSPFCAS
jgi:uncharacterized repeat protein (TIGR01451 family)